MRWHDFFYIDQVDEVYQETNRHYWQVFSKIDNKPIDNRLYYEWYEAMEYIARKHSFIVNIINEEFEKEVLK